MISEERFAAAGSFVERAIAERDAARAKVQQMSAAIRLISPDHLSPMGKRILDQALGDPALEPGQATDAPADDTELLELLQVLKSADRGPFGISPAEYNQAVGMLEEHLGIDGADRG